MTVKEAIEFLKGLDQDQDLPLILYHDVPTFGYCPDDAELQLIQLDQRDAEMLGCNVGQQAVMIS